MNKAFTLIELLAVIVVLSVIALIATPIILNLINDSKESSASRSMEGFVDSINIASILYSSRNDDGIINNYEDIKDLVDVKNKEKIKNPMVVIDENGSVQYALANVDNYYCTYEKNKRVKCNETLEIGTTIYFNPVSGNLCNDYNKENSTGNANSGCLKWYVINDNKKDIDLILDHNTTSVVRWVSKEDYGLLAEEKGLDKQTAMSNYELAIFNELKIGGLNDLGPKTVIDALKEDTKGWSEILTRSDKIVVDQSRNPSKANYIVDYTGFKARLITVQEIANIVGYTDTLSKKFFLDGYPDSWSIQTANNDKKSKYAWLYDYTSDCEKNGCNESNPSNKGYWTSISWAEDVRFSWRVSSDGSIHAGLVNYDDLFGVRPVITLSKSIFN